MKLSVVVIVVSLLACVGLTYGFNIVFIKYPHGEGIYAKNMSDYTTIAEVKESVADRVEQPISRITLLDLKGITMEDKKCLKDYDIKGKYSDLVWVKIKSNLKEKLLNDHL